MNLVNASELAKHFGNRTLLTGVQFSLCRGDRVGLIGNNGTGKTSLFKLIRGEMEPDAGTLAIAKGLQTGYLSQTFNMDESQSLLEAVLGAFGDLLDMERKIELLTERIGHTAGGEEQARLLEEFSALQTLYENRGGYTYKSKAEKILMGLGFSLLDFRKRLGALSGGQKNRAAMARLFLWSPELLLLDEPTNFLDMQAIEWLEDYLLGYPGTFVVISHDRYFLDRVCNKIWEIERQTLTAYDGNFTRSRELKAEFLKAHRREFEKQRRFIDKEQEFIRRYKAGQRSKEAKGREKRLQNIELIEEIREETGGFSLALEPRKPSGVDILHLKELTIGFDRPLFEKLDMEVQRGQKIGIIGPNGAGKSTFFKAILGELEPLGGKAEWGKSLEIAYYDQEHRGLNSANTVFKEVAALAHGFKDEEIRDFLALFLFCDSDVDKEISQLSGGEKARVALAKIILKRPNVLLMDEPTNHLDIASREALESALVHYTGTLFVISHDRYFLNTIANRILYIGNGVARAYWGDYDQFRRKLAAGVTDGEDSLPAQRTAEKQTSHERRLEKQDAQRLRKLKRQNEARLKKVEAEIYKLEERQKQIHAELEKVEVYTDARKCLEYSNEIKALEQDLSELFVQWEQLTALDVDS